MQTFVIETQNFQSDESVVFEIKSIMNLKVCDFSRYVR